MKNERGLLWMVVRGGILLASHNLRLSNVYQKHPSPPGPQAQRYLMVVSGPRDSCAVMHLMLDVSFGSGHLKATAR
jgi:hypothetical protein